MARRKRTPSANVYWRDLPAGACIIDRGNVFVAKMGRKSAVVFWHGQEARAAQTTLAKRAAKGCKR